MAGPITTLQAQLSISMNVTTAYDTAPAPGGNTGLSSPVSLGRLLNFQNLSSPPTGTIKATQVKLFQETIAASGTLTLDLSAATANVAGDSTGTFAHLIGIVLWLPATTDPLPTGLTLTVQATSVVVGNNSGGSNQNILFLNAAADGITLVPGRMICYLDSVSSILVNGTHKSVLLTNGDGVNAATVLWGIIGLDA